MWQASEEYEQMPDKVCEFQILFPVEVSSYCINDPTQHYEHESEKRNGLNHGIKEDDCRPAHDDI